MLWLTNSANVHAVDLAFQATMAIFGAVPHHIFHRDESLEACWGLSDVTGAGGDRDGSTEGIDGCLTVCSFDSDSFGTRRI